MAEEDYIIERAAMDACDEVLKAISELLEQETLRIATANCTPEKPILVTQEIAETVTTKVLAAVEQALS